MVEINHPWGEFLVNLLHIKRGLFNATKKESFHNENRRSKLSCVKALIKLPRTTLKLDKDMEISMEISFSPPSHPPVINSNQQAVHVQGFYNKLTIFPYRLQLPTEPTDTCRHPKQQRRSNNFCKSLTCKFPPPNKQNLGLPKSVTYI